jgi:hypothetical protein
MSNLEDYWNEVRVGDKGEYSGYTGQVAQKIEGPPHKIVLEAVKKGEGGKAYKWNEQIGYTEIDPRNIKALEARYGRGGKRKTRGRKHRKHKRKTRKH